MSWPNHPHHNDPAAGAHGAGDSAVAFNNSSDTEWGSKQLIRPAFQVGTGGNVPATGLGNPIRLINLQGGARQTRMVTIALFSAGFTNGTGFYQPGGPLIAIANFSGGAGGGTIEFDVPSNATPVSSQVSDGGGAMVCLPASNLDVRVRNDGAFVPNAGIANAIPIGQNFVTDQLVPMVSAHVGMGSKTGRLTRTVYLVAAQAGGIPWASIPANQRTAPVPPFARSFRVLRFQTVPADVISVSIMNPDARTLEQFDLAGTDISPEFILGPASFVQLDFPGGNTGAVNSLVLVFNIENGGD